MTFRLGYRPLNCIAGDDPNRRFLLNTSKYDYIYQLSNTKWSALLGRSYTPVTKDHDEIEELYPLTVDMVTLVENIQKGEKIEENKINIYPHKFLSTPTDLCGNFEESKKVFLLFLIKTSFRHFSRRHVIRETWANNQILKELHIERVFIVGRMVGRNRLHHKMRVEVTKESDILEIDMIDNYYNNTWKSMGGVKFALNNCPHAEYVMIVDDDFFIATDNLVALLQVMKAKKEKFIYMGWVNQNPRADRHYGSKWYVTHEDYPYDDYPEFISAGAIVMGMDFVQNLHIASQYTKYFKFDDVFIAIVAKKLNIYPMNNFLFYIYKVEYSDVEFWKVIASHGFADEQDLRGAWKCHRLIKEYGVHPQYQWELYRD